MNIPNKKQFRKKPFPSKDVHTRKTVKTVPFSPFTVEKRNKTLRSARAGAEKTKFIHTTNRKENEELSSTDSILIGNRSRI